MDNPKTLARGVAHINVDAGFAFAAFVVSMIGACTTVELLCRRTASRGFYNWFILVSSSLSMGGIAVWGMHSIASQAIIIGNGAIEQQLMFDPGFRTLSFFIPVLVLLIAFSVIGTSDEKFDAFRVLLGGKLVGFGFCCMHFVNMAGLTNYNCLFRVVYVIITAVIAIIASSVALGIFSYFRTSWKIRWWTRLLVAVMLALAVSGTHWIATAGTQYHFKNDVTQHTSGYSRDSTCLGVIILSVSLCVTLLLIAVLGQRRLKFMKIRSQQIAVAAVLFDEEGKIMVTPDGYLPHRRITDTYLERTMDDVFSISHPLFIWMFRTSFNWSGVAPLIRSMRAHLEGIGIKTGNRPHEGYLTTDQGIPVENYSEVFRELFCTAVSELADDFHLPLESMGVLYDSILAIGQLPKNRSKYWTKLLDTEKQDLIQENPESGQLLFLAKEVDIREAYHLQAAGFRFASVPKVIGKLAPSVQSSEVDMLNWLKNIRYYVSTDHAINSGVHLACFTIRASMIPGRGGFEVLARKDATNLLPTMRLPIDRVEPWQSSYISKHDGQTVAAFLKIIRKTSLQSNPSEGERVFAKQLLTRLEGLRNEIDDPFFYDARLIGKPLKIPCQGWNKTSTPGTATIVVFQIILPVQSRAPGKKLDFVPVNFFKMQQFVNKDSPDHGEYARRTIKEFAPILGMQITPTTPGTSGGRHCSKEALNSLQATKKADRRTFVDDLFEICIARK